MLNQAIGVNHTTQGLNNETFGILITKTENKVIFRLMFPLI